MSKLDFGIFMDFWDGSPNHLPLLGLVSHNNESKVWNLNNSIEKLDFICNNNSEDLISEGVRKLLDNEDWRPHLVAILASLKLSNKEQQILVPILWKKLENGSWISPQILSVLSIIDEKFEVKARQILNDGFEVTYSKMNMMEHHSSRGPKGSKDASEKVIQAIKSLLENQDDCFGWKSRLIQLIDNKRFLINSEK